MTKLSFSSSGKRKWSLLGPTLVWYCPIAKNWEFFCKERSKWIQLLTSQANWTKLVKIKILTWFFFSCHTANIYILFLNLCASSSADESLTWTCDFVGSYHNYQATHCCFSEDGSLLAVSFDKTITVWDSETWDLKCTFCHPPGTIMYVLVCLLFWVLLFCLYLNHFLKTPFEKCNVAVFRSESEMFFSVYNFL